MQCSAPATDPSMRLCRQLQMLEEELRGVQGIVGPLALGPGLDHCLLRHQEEQISSLKRELSDVSQNILSLQRGEEDLLDQASAFKKAFCGLSL